MRGARPIGRWATLWVALTASAAAADDYSFDVTAFEKKPFEWSGFVELRSEHFDLDRDAALYRLNTFDQAQDLSPRRFTGSLELNGLYRKGIASVQGTWHGDTIHDDLQDTTQGTLYEGFVALDPATGVRLEAGKRAQRWGKGYAFSAVGFVERVKDPNDPTLSREGFVMLGGSFTRSLDGPLQTATFTPLLVPTGDDLNTDFGPGDHANPAARLSLLYRDTDIDFLYLGSGARSARFGVDFSRNLASHIEIHGEWAYISEVDKPVLEAGGNLSRNSGSAQSFLLGLRYLSESEVTTIVEYYYNGAGYDEGELSDYLSFVQDGYAQSEATGNSAALQKARQVQPSYARPNAGQRYLYLRSSWKDAFDILYLTPALTVIANLDDRSYQVTPEFSYTGIENLELRLRLSLLQGDALTEFGEKPNDRRAELRLRYFF